MSNYRIIAVQTRSAQPTGLQMIVMWSGTLDSIPAGWHLCDGSAATPNLSDRFVLSYPDSLPLTDAARQTGAAMGLILGHSHRGLFTDDEAGHQHPVVGGFVQVGGMYNYALGSSGAAAHSHGGVTPPGEAHFHYTPGTGYHVDNLTVSTIPPYYALAYIAGRGDIPVGGLALVFLLNPYPQWVWDGSSWIVGPSPLPAGYVVCDGRNGTPDLWERYVLGAGNAFLLNQAGGDYYLSVASHQHSNGDILVTAEDDHTHLYGNDARWSNATALPSTTLGIDLGLQGAAEAVYHNHQMDVDVPTGTVVHTHSTNKPLFREEASTASSESYPPSYRLTWIMRVS